MATGAAPRAGSPENGGAPPAGEPTLRKTMADGDWPWVDGGPR